MTKYLALYQDSLQKLAKALEYLRYSYKKVEHLPTDPKLLDPETLEVWESFCARFSRVTDLFLMRVVRSHVQHTDPGFQGTLRDYVNQGEKLGLVDNADLWMDMRELRNISAHEYNDQGLTQFLQTLRTQCPHLLALQKIIDRASQT